MSKSNSAANRPALLHSSARAALGDLGWEDIERLKPPKNYARKRHQRAEAMLQGALEQFEVLVPALVDGSDVILDGVARVEAAKRIGHTRYPVFRVSHLTPAMAKAFSIAVNQIPSRASWDSEKLLATIDEILLEQPDLSVECMGFTIGETDAFRIHLPGQAENDPDPADAVIDLPELPVSRIGDLWCLGGHRLLNGSSLDAAAWQLLMAGAIAAMMFSDPPFNVPIKGHVSGKGKKKHAEFIMASGEMEDEDFIEFLQTAIRRACAHLKGGAVLQICMDWRHQWELLSATRMLGLKQLNLCVWNKTNGSMGSLYRSKHELVGIYKYGDERHRNNVELGKHGRYRTNVWDYAGANCFGATRMEDLAAHATVKPTALVADAICDVSAPGEIVIDGFMGSGTTILAAERTRRIAYGIELEPRFVDVAIRRWQKMTGREARLEATGQSFAEVEHERALSGASSVPSESIVRPDIAPPPRRRAA